MTQNESRIDRFVQRWIHHYGMDATSSVNKFVDCYPLQMLTADECKTVRRQADGAVEWMLQMRIESDLKLLALNRLTTENEGVEVSDVDISGSLIEVRFFLLRVE